MTLLLNDDKIAEGSLRPEGLFRAHNDKSPLISIVTIVLNRKLSLENTIESVVGQNYDNIEYIVIDGGSTDGSVDIIKKHEKGIDYWISEPDKGISDAFNKGIRRASGQYLLFLNSDDRLHSTDSIMEIAQAMDDEYDIVAGYVDVGNGYYPKKPITSHSPFGKKIMLNHQGCFINRNLFKKLGLYDESYNMRMDYEFLVRCFSKNTIKIKFVESIVSRYNLGEGRVTYLHHSKDYEIFYKEAINALTKNNVMHITLIKTFIIYALFRLKVGMLLFRLLPLKDIISWFSTQKKKR